MPFDIDDADATRRLAPVDGALLHAIRCWVIGSRTGQDATGAIADTLRPVGLESAMPVLNALLWTISCGITRPVEINCTCQTSMTEDEQLLLDMFALQQEGRPEDAESLLQAICNERAASLAGECMLRIVLQLGASGLALDPAGGALRRHAFRDRMSPGAVLPLRALAN